MSTRSCWRRTCSGSRVLIALPALVTFALALTEYDLIRSPRFIGLQNFRDLWERRDLPQVGPQLADVHPLRRASAARGRACVRPPAAPEVPRRGRISDVRLPADGGARRRVRAALALDHQPAVRAAQPRARRHRRADAGVAHRPTRRTVGRDPDEPLRHRRGLHRRHGDAAGNSERALRAGRRRGRDTPSSCSGG